MRSGLYDLLREPHPPPTLSSAASAGPPGAVEGCALNRSHPRPGRHCLMQNTQTAPPGDISSVVQAVAVYKEGTSTVLVPGKGESNDETPLFQVAR